MSEELKGIDEIAPFTVIMSRALIKKLRAKGKLCSDGTIIGQYAMGAPIKVVPNGPVRGLEGTAWTIDEATVVDDESFRQEYMAEFVKTEEE
jgi:hypothetical protein